MKKHGLVGGLGLLAITGFLGMAAAATDPATSGTASQDVGVEAGDVEYADDDAFDSESFESAYRRSEEERYDALRSSPSPRQQVLAGQIYLENEDETPAMVRPKRTEVVARAVQLAPDDAFVQWMAANQGNYWSSQCGPTRRPEAEVANIVRLEPDNVAAWQFAVALASVIGDEAGVDDALSRMAAASRADDHVVEQIDEWTRIYAEYPQPATPWQGTDQTLSADAAAHIAAMQKIAYRSSSAASVVVDVCKMEVSTDRIWQRLGWCADAATTLATRGSSLALRKQGLELLAAIGQTTGPVEAMQKSHDWLQANSAIPAMYFDDSSLPEEALGDWHGAKTEIEAIENRLRRTGKSLEPPPTWTRDSDIPEPHFSEAQVLVSQYVVSLLEMMRTDSDVRLQALAASADTSFFDTDIPAAQESSSSSLESTAELAARNPDIVLVQWIAAGLRMDEPGSDAHNAAITRVQRLEPDNGAAWALSLATDVSDTDDLLATIASARSYDEHGGEILGLWLEAIEHHPPSAEIIEAIRLDEPEATDPAATLRARVAMMMAMTVSSQGVMGIARACAQEDVSKSENCEVIARQLLHQGKTQAAAGVGEMILRRIDALDADDSARTRQVAWWRDFTMTASATDDDALDRFLKDSVSTGSEIEAMRLAAQRAGKETPPESWQWPPARRRPLPGHHSGEG